MTTPTEQSDRSKRLPRTALAVGAIVIAAFALSLWSFYAGHRNACDARDAALNVTRDVLRLTEPTTAERDQIPQARLDRADLFYANAYARIDAARCQ